MSDNNIEIIPFQPELSHHFLEINRLWIEKYFRMEPEDLSSLEAPHKHIIEKGGAIIFAKYKDQIVGTCGLKKWSDSEYELVKMGVLEGFQGLHIGKKLGLAMIEIAKEKGCRRLFLETNSVLTPAIKLYEKLGFKAYNNCTSRCDYQRCDYYMEQFLVQE